MADKWLTDKNGNKCSVEYFGTEEAAQKALDSLKNCDNTELAAMLIYRESGYRINPARFYDSNEAALADMKKLAEKEK